MHVPGYVCVRINCFYICRDYRKAYHLIVEVVPTMVDHILEFKVVSGYCSYKVLTVCTCILMYVCGMNI